MFKKVLIMAALAAGLLIPTISQGTATDSGDITITATVDSYFAWNIASSTIAAADWSGGTGGHIDGTHKTLTVSLPIAATTNATAVISFQPSATLNHHNGVLTNGSDTLKTSYTVTNTPTKTFMTNGGTNLGTYVEADGTNSTGIFDAATNWNLSTANVNGDTTFSLDVKAEMPGTVVNPAAGNYSCIVLLRATW